MSDARPIQESEIIEQLAARYRARGYDVQRDVALEGLPFQADLVARRADETVLIEVKGTAPGRTGAPLEQLAEFAERHGWRFSIALTTDRSTFEEIEVPSHERVTHLIADARTVTTYPWIASLAAVAALEAAGRYALARTEGRSPPRPTSLALVQALAAQGLVTPPEERLLRELVAARNAAAHGLSGKTFPADLVAAGLAIAESLVAGQTAAA